MTDKTISNLPKTTTLTTTDTFVVVGGGVTSKIELNDLAKNVKEIIAPVTSDVPVAGVVGLTHSLTSLTGAVTVLSLPMATAGQTKLFVVDGYNSPITINVINGNGFSTITMTAVGQTVNLIYTTRWNVLSNYGSTIS
jgi:hypothetical protein